MTKLSFSYPRSVYALAVDPRIIVIGCLGLHLLVTPLYSDNRAIWEDNGLIQDETVLFHKDELGIGSASLSRLPEAVVSVTSADGGESYPISRFTISKGRVIADSSVRGYTSAELYPEEGFPMTARKHLQDGKLILYGERITFHSKQVNLTYQTAEKWGGPLPRSQAQRLPRFTSSLKGKKATHIVLLGDSISAGANASGASKAQPNQPPYSGLLIRKLRDAHGADVRLTNLAVGGKNALWGLEQVPAVIAQRPDLLIIAFGMNDGSGKISPHEFYLSIREIVTQVRLSSPNTEFVLVSGMTPNPEWSSAEPEKREELHHALKRLAEEELCAFGDIYSIWNYLVAKKGFLAMAGNGINHPNDFGHRLYANVLAATILEPEE